MWGAMESWRSTAKLLTQARRKSAMLQVLHHLAGTRGRGRDDMDTEEGREVLRLEGWLPVVSSLEGKKRGQKMIKCKRESSKQCEVAPLWKGYATECARRNTTGWESGKKVGG